MKERKRTVSIEGPVNPGLVLDQEPPNKDEGDVKVHFPDAVGNSVHSQSLLSDQSRDNLKLDVEK